MSTPRPPFLTPQPPATPRSVRLRSVPASQGAQWLWRGFALFFQHPFSFIGLMSLVLIVSLLLAIQPVVGGFLLFTAFPLITLGFMIATESALAGGRIHPAQFVEPLAADRGQRGPLLILGVVYACSALAFALLGLWIGGDAINQMVDAVVHTEPGTLPILPPDAAAAVTRAELTFFLGMSLVSVPLWHAPPLVHWAGQRAMQAMFSSALAMWRTRGAFLVYSLTLTAVNIGLAVASGVLVGLLGATAMLLLVPMTLCMPAVFYVSLWFGFCDTFEIVPAGESANGT